MLINEILLKGEPMLMDLQIRQQQTQMPLDMKIYN